jgi:MFS superfamily sulfate permease-like transporter
VFGVVYSQSHLGVTHFSEKKTTNPKDVNKSKTCQQIKNSLNRNTRTLNTSNKKSKPKSKIKSKKQQQKVQKQNTNSSKKHN